MIKRLTNAEANKAVPVDLDPNFKVVEASKSLHDTLYINGWVQ